MVSMVDQMVDQNATYLTRRRGVHYYYTRRIPKELQQRLGKKRIVVSLKMGSRRKAILNPSFDDWPKIHSELQNHHRGHCLVAPHIKSIGCCVFGRPPNANDA